MTGTVGEDESSNDELHFVSTQIQARYEESLQEDAQRQRVSQLQVFRLMIDATPSLTEESDSSNHNSSKQVKPIHKKIQLSGSRRKISSMTSLMKEKYSGDGRGVKDSTSQLTILQFLSGKKQKVAEILRKIELSDSRSKDGDAGEQSKPFAYSGAEDNAGTFLYSKHEWARILKNIKLRFPSLSSETRRSLQHITRKIQLQHRATEIPDETGSIWTQTSTAPSDDEYNLEDMKWLYDLNEEQMEYLGRESQHSSETEHYSDLNEVPPLFILTLSQVMNDRADIVTTDEEGQPQEVAKHTANTLSAHQVEPDQTQRLLSENGPETADVRCESAPRGEDEEIPNSSPEMSPIYVATSSPPPLPAKLQILETMYEETKEPISSHQRESIVFEPLSFPIKEKQPSVVYSDVEEVEEIFSSSLPIPHEQRYRDPEIEEIVSSPLKAHEKHERARDVFKTPTKSIRVLKPHSGPSPIKRFDLLDSPTKTTATPRKRYLKSVVEIRGGMEISEEPAGNQRIKVRKIGTRIEPPIDSEEEIEDSNDEQDTSISIIEISRVVEEPRLDTSEKANPFILSPPSVIQVPSSPRNEQPGVRDNKEEGEEEEGDGEEEEEDIFNTARNVFENDSQGAETPAESQKFESMNASQLRETFKQWGLKPVQGKAKMLKVLNDLSQHIDAPAGGLSQLDIHTSIHSKINQCIKANIYWYDKVLSYEPILLCELKQWLAENDIHVEMDVLERYADDNGITTTNKANV